MAKSFFVLNLLVSNRFSDNLPPTFPVCCRLFVDGFGSTSESLATLPCRTFYLSIELSFRVIYPRTYKIIILLSTIAILWILYVSEIEFLYDRIIEKVNYNAIIAQFISVWLYIQWLWISFHIRPFYFHPCPLSD